MSCNRNIATAWLILAVVAVVYAAMSWLTPLMFDDLLFISGYREITGGDAFTIEGYAEYFMQLRNNDNSRLSNEAFPAIILWPGTRVIFNVLTGLMMSMIILLVSRIVTSRWTPSRGCCIAVWFALLFTLPWRNNLFVTNYSLNYIYSAVITLTFAIAMLRLLKGGAPKLFVAATLLLGLLTGAWHEGFAAPILGALGVVGCIDGFRRRHVSVPFWSIIIISAAVMLAFALSPGILNRAGRELGGDVSLSYRLPRLVANNYLVIGTVILVAVGAFASKGRKLIASAFADSWCLLFALCALFGLAICMVVNPTPRTAFWPQLAATVLWLRWLWLRYHQRVTGWKRIAAITVMSVFIAVQSSVSIYWQHKYYVEHNKIVAMLEKSPGTVFYDVIDPGDVPLISMYMPVRIEFHDVFGPYAFTQYYGRKDIAVVPTALDTDVVKGRRVASNIYIVGDEVVADSIFEGWPFIEINAIVTLEDGSQVPMVFDGFQFHDSTGREVTWLKQRVSVYGNSRHDAARISHIELLTDDNSSH